MKYLFFGIALFLIAACSPEKSQRPDYVLVIHGGAGVMNPKDFTPELEKAYLDKLQEALDSGKAVLKTGGAALDAVVAAVKVMEDSPLFNAGKGSVFSETGENEMDAAIMNGKDLSAGAVAGVRTIKNPILAARKVMEESKHVMLVRDGAEKFAMEHGVEIVDPSYFFDQKRYDALLKAQKHGTVGAVALDKSGNLAAATSTGGMTNKMTGRVGDTPIIGAGTYANNNTCAVSATGHGEFFIRYTVAHDISALMEYKGLTLEEAATEVIFGKLLPVDGTGGIIAVDKDGNYTMTFNTSGMFRGVVTADGKREVAIYKIFSESPLISQ
ncbi:MAG: isoaspartyl peptidase/L-asparaginase [Bacteroidales bacterium]|nr:isoaspartyl peptidase/L-asparaginase [Bacteroidales bacterium]